MSADQYGNEIKDVPEVFAGTSDSFSKFKREKRSDWSQHCHDLKVQQAFDKLESLGYYHDSGLYGWLPNKNKAMEDSE